MCCYNSVDFDLILESFNLCVLVFKLRAELIGSHLLRLHDLHQVDVLLHEHLTLDDEVRVAGMLTQEVKHGSGDSNYSTVMLLLSAKHFATTQYYKLIIHLYSQACKLLT